MHRDIKLNLIEHDNLKYGEQNGVQQPLIAEHLFRERVLELQVNKLHIFLNLHRGDFNAMYYKVFYVKFIKELLLLGNADMAVHHDDGIQQIL